MKLEFTDNAQTLCTGSMYCFNRQRLIKKNTCICRSCSMAIFRGTTKNARHETVGKENAKRA